MEEMESVKRKEDEKWEDMEDYNPIYWFGNVENHHQRYNKIVERRITVTYPQNSKGCRVIKTQERLPENFKNWKEVDSIS